MIRTGKAEKREIIHLVEHSALSVKKTLDELQVPRSTFYRWYKQYLEEGEAGVTSAVMDGIFWESFNERNFESWGLGSFP